MPNNAPTRLPTDYVPVYTLTTGRIFGTLAVLVALAGLILAVRTLARPGRSARTRSIIALSSGAAGFIGGAVVTLLAKGGPGTGYGVVGGWVALAFGLAAILVGWLSLTRTRRTTA